MSSPADRRYSESHEWFLADGDVVTIGITTHATEALTDITYVEMKAAGTSLAAGDSAGEVESVKTTSDVYSVVGGEITEVNQAVVDDPAALELGKRLFHDPRLSSDGSISCGSQVSRPVAALCRHRASLPE
jgi:glycine cleavage system H protein